jgi:hypothetical protein
VIADRIEFLSPRATAPANEGAAGDDIPF